MHEFDDVLVGLPSPVLVDDTAQAVTFRMWYGKGRIPFRGDGGVHSLSCMVV